jgi:hypothetical protein
MLLVVARPPHTADGTHPLRSSREALREAFASIRPRSYNAVLLDVSLPDTQALEAPQLLTYWLPLSSSVILSERAELAAIDQMLTCADAAMSACKQERGSSDDPTAPVSRYRDGT